jgi:hypothetical protein
MNSRKGWVHVSMSDNDEAHGTVSGYYTLQCRCDRCRDVMRRYEQKRHTARIYPTPRT